MQFRGMSNWRGEQHQARASLWSLGYGQIVVSASLPKTPLGRRALVLGGLSACQTERDSATRLGFSSSSLSKSNNSFAILLKYLGTHAGSWTPEAPVAEHSDAASPVVPGSSYPSGTIQNYVQVTSFVYPPPSVQPATIHTGYKTAHTPILIDVTTQCDKGVGLHTVSLPTWPPSAFCPTCHVYRRARCDRPPQSYLSTA